MGYAEAFSSVQSDSHTSEWYGYFDNDVLVLVPVTPARQLFRTACFSAQKDPEKNPPDPFLYFTDSYSPLDICRLPLPPHGPHGSPILQETVRGAYRLL